MGGFIFSSDMSDPSLSNDSIFFSIFCFDVDLDEDELLTRELSFLLLFSLLDFLLSSRTLLCLSFSLSLSLSFLSLYSLYSLSLLPLFESSFDLYSLSVDEVVVELLPDDFQPCHQLGVFVAAFTTSSLVSITA